MSEMPPTAEVETKPIVFRENVLITISATALLALVIGVFRFGVSFAEFKMEQKETTKAISELKTEVMSMRSELIAYVDAQVNIAAAKRYTTAHDEVRTALFRQRLLTLPNGNEIGKAYPDFDELAAHVERYSIADRAVKASKP